MCYHRIMSKRLLGESEALRKIELSLKLQGKSFKSDFLSCDNCKFCWRNIVGGRPTHQQFISGGNLNPAPAPEKWRWYCFKYKGVPYHAYLRFNVVRLDANGKEIRQGGRWLPDGTFTTDPPEGCKDTLVLRRSGTRWRYSVCRRFESAPRSK